MKSKLQKRVEAEQRNNEWAKLPTPRKLATLMKRPGQSLKQRERLWAQARCPVGEAQ